jgi:MFS family permease
VGRRHLAIAAAAVLVGAADTYVVVLILPELMRGIGLDTSELQRAAPLVSGFLLGYVALLPAAGRISDLVGRAPVLVGCLAMFVGGAVVTATAHGLTHAVIGRLLQGIGAGGLVPATLALVADGWPAERRAMPLGVIGAVQEAGAVLGPLVGALVLAVTGWRAVFWGAAALMLALALTLRRGELRHELRSRDSSRDWPGALLALAAIVVGLLALVAPQRLVESVRFGGWWVPTGAGPTPIALLALGLAVLLVLRELTASSPWLGLRRVPALLGAADGWGILLGAVSLGGVVLAFAGADPERSALSDSAPLALAVSGGAGVLFVLRQRVASQPLIPRGTVRGRQAVGSLLVSVLVGTALVAVLVDVPVYARTTLSHSTQLDAALVLLRFLVAVPVGAVVGGWATRRLGAFPVGAAGLAMVTAGLLAMSQWGLHALTRQEVPSNAALVAAGLGFGLAVAPVSSAALARTVETSHGIMSSLVIVARTVGMLVGLSALSAVGLHVYADRAAGIPSPVTLCPDTPTRCAAFSRLTRMAVVDELQVIFLLAAGCAAAAAVTCTLLLPSGKSDMPGSGGET